MKDRYKIKMNETSKFCALKAFRFSIIKGDIIMKTHGDKMTYYMTIRNFSNNPNARPVGFKFEGNFMYSFLISVEQEEVEILVESIGTLERHFLKCGVTISTDSGEVLFQKTLNNEAEGCLCKFIVFAKGEDFQRIMQFPKDNLLFICRIISTGADESSNIKDFTVGNTEYLMRLKTDLKSLSASLSKEKVYLSIGSQTKAVNKAILCARSPIFAKMLKHSTKSKEHTITITGIKMIVFEALVSFLYSGIVPYCTFDILSKLYSAAVKYGVKELHHACINLFLRDIFLSRQNLEIVFQVLNLSMLHNDELLKSAVMMLLSANIETIALTSYWENLMRDDPELALKAATFFDL